jgi:hypothetical protein
LQGLFLENHIRPRSKKEVKEHVPNIILEATSMLDNEYDGPLDTAPDGCYTFVGPCPFTNRKFYGKIVKRNGKVVVE